MMPNPTRSSCESTVTFSPALRNVGGMGVGVGEGEDLVEPLGEAGHEQLDVGNSRGVDVTPTPHVPL